MKLRCRALKAKPEGPLYNLRWLFPCFLFLCACQFLNHDIFFRWFFRLLGDIPHLQSAYFLIRFVPVVHFDRLRQQQYSINCLQCSHKLPIRATAISVTFFWTQRICLQPLMEWSKVSTQTCMVAHITYTWTAGVISVVYYIHGCDSWMPHFMDLINLPTIVFDKRNSFLYNEQSIAVLFVWFE